MVGRETLVATANAIRNGVLTPESYAQELLRRHAHWSKLNAIVHLDSRALLAAARLANKTPNENRGPLFGIPILLKDNINTRGVPTTACTPGLSNNIPKRDAPVAERLFEAGALLFGKANMHELAFGATNNGGLFGCARNPYDLNRIPGGSSGGSAAAVAAGYVPAAIGSDTAGSVRLPAALCGVCGFRPTTGRYPSAGIVPLSRTRDTAGPIGLTVSDVALLDAILAGETPPIHQKANLSSLRLGVPREFFHDNLNPEVAEAFEGALDLLGDNGASLIEKPIPSIAALVEAAAPPIIRYEIQGELERYLESHCPEFSVSQVVSRILDPTIRKAYHVNPHTDDNESSYRGAMGQHRPHLQHVIREYLTTNRLDAYLIPAVPTVAPFVGEDENFKLGGKDVPTTRTLLRNTSPSTVAGNPSLVIPSGLSGDGLPIAIMLEAGAGHDTDVLSIGTAIEEQLDPIAGPRPPNA